MIKDVLVRLEAGEHDETRIAHAEQLAARQGAFLTGVLINRLPNIAVGADPSMMAAQVIIDQQKAAQRTGEQAEAKLRERFDRLGVNSELRRYDLFDWQVAEVLTTEARTADVFVDLRPYGHGEQDAQTGETVMFGSGRAMLMVPPASEASDFDSVMVAWVNTREAARAVTEAIPIMQRAETVNLVMVGGRFGPDGSEEPGADIARHLDRHGVSVEIVHVKAADDVAAALMAQAAALKSDLMVMGGYGHSRFREWALGGVTLDILTRAEVPVLVAH